MADKALGVEQSSDELPILNHECNFFFLRSKDQLV